MKTLVSILSKIGNEKIVPCTLVIKNNKILIGLRNYTPDKWKDISVWTIPGGRCDKNELIKITLLREVVEEVGINDLKINKFLGKFPGAKDGDTVYLFLSETDQEPKLMEPEKFSEWKWISIDEMPSNFINKYVSEFVKNNKKIVMV